LQPTLFWDVAAANGYEIKIRVADLDWCDYREIQRREDIHQLWNASGDAPNNLLLLCVLKKTTDAPFRIPFQGYYDKTLSESAKQAWHIMR
jgi:hypothetical protein